VGLNIPYVYDTVKNYRKSRQEWKEVDGMKTLGRMDKGNSSTDSVRR
jgi:hypothetical protein